MNILELEKFKIGTEFKKILYDDTIGKVIFIRNVNGISYEDAEEGDFICCDFQNLNSKYCEYITYRKFKMGTNDLNLCKLFIQSFTKSIQSLYKIQKLKINNNADIICYLNDQTWKNETPIFDTWNENVVKKICELKAESEIYCVYNSTSNQCFWYLYGFWHKINGILDAEILEDNLEQNNKNEERTYTFNYNGLNQTYTSQNNLYEHFLSDFDYDNISINENFIEINLTDGN
jgi:hypothetical protein